MLYSDPTDNKWRNRTGGSDTYILHAGPVGTPVLPSIEHIVSRICRMSCGIKMTRNPRLTDVMHTGRIMYNHHNFWRPRGRTIVELARIYFGTLQVGEVPVIGHLGGVQ